PALRESDACGFSPAAAGPTRAMAMALRMPGKATGRARRDRAPCAPPRRAASPAVVRGGPRAQRQLVI
ncbi:MAG: hypothetical protein QNJ91_05365, partial [Gammaproteobacteria bacterium]|nr:hypothetical protein [Gammaproteobacteria bacterium]